MTIILPHGYKPSEKEPFMCPEQLEYFRLKLEEHKENLLKDIEEYMLKLQNSSESSRSDIKDEADIANNESENALELRITDRYRKLVKKIEAALLRIENGTYGYCIKSGDPISLRRLEAKPDATMTIEAQTQHDLEKNDKI